MVIQWIVIAVLVLLGLWFLQFEHHTRKLKIAAAIAIVALLYFSMMTILTSEEIDLTNPRGVVNAVYVYFGWVGQTASTLWDIGTDTTKLVGNAIKINRTEERVR
jgi:hypothetical protein